MGRYDGILLMSDFDGTLFCDGTVSEENREAIKYFQSEGGLFSLCSGRLPSHLLKCAEYFVPNTWSAMLNGTLFCDATTQVRALELPLGDDIEDFSREVIDACPKLDFVRFHTYDRSVNFKPIPNRTFEGSPRPNFKMVYHVPTELSDEYTKIITELAGDRYYVARSWVNGIDVQRAGVSKGAAVDRMRELLGDRVKTVVAVGDYENDVELIKSADIGYAVANAVPQMLEAADRVTVSCHESAIAKIISEL